MNVESTAGLAGLCIGLSPRIALSVFESREYRREHQGEGRLPHWLAAVIRSIGDIGIELAPRPRSALAFVSRIPAHRRRKRRRHDAWRRAVGMGGARGAARIS